jgi:hypothetical protein
MGTNIKGNFIKATIMEKVSSNILMVRFTKENSGWEKRVAKEG